MEEWKTYKLGQIARVQTGPFGSQLHQSDYVDEGVPCIMPVNIGNGLSLLPDGIAKVTEDDANRLSKHRVNAGDIVYSRRGDIERCAFISKEQEGWLCGTGCLRVCDFVPGINPQFIAYCLSLPSTKAWLVSNAVGTTMLNLNTSILSDISLSIPDFDTQNKIVRIIDSFDSKIGINNRINHNLAA